MTMRSNRARCFLRSRESGTVSYEGVGHIVPSPLVGEGQGEGYYTQEDCFRFDSTQNHPSVLVLLDPLHRINLARRTLSPPLSLSLSLPRKGGGNVVALLCPTATLHSRSLPGARTFAPHQPSRRP